MDRVCFGVDIGGTAIKFGMFDENMELLQKWEIETPTEENGKNILTAVAQEIKNKISESPGDEIIGVGLCAPGPGSADGVIHGCINLGWDEFDLMSRLKWLTGQRVWVTNDGNAAALGELLFGAAGGMGNAVMVTIGTGIGGGILHDGNVITGALGAAGELGHIRVVFDESAKPCRCGRMGCLETVASGRGMADLGESMLSDFAGETCLKKGEITAKAIFDGVNAGDELSAAIAKKTMGYLAQALAAVGAVMDPQAFIIGGGVSGAGQALIDMLKEAYEEKAFKGNQGKRFLLAALGNDAGIYGCAAKVIEEDTMAREEVFAALSHDFML